MRYSFITLVAISFALIFGIPSIHAQDGTTSITVEEMRDMARTTHVPVYQAVETKGSPFFNDDFADGSVTFKNGQTTNVLPLRFNAYEGTVQFRDGNNILAIDSNTIEEFELYAADGIIRFTKGYDARRLSEDEFVAVLADGNAKFMVKYSVNYHEDVSGYGQATQVEEYVPSENYYVKIGDGDVDRIRSLSQRRVMRTFPSHTDQLEEYANQNNIQFDNVQDVAKIFNHYNSLISEQ
ncbi:hypothetical protein BH23BAC3_BH23BAC3_14680 [soil metagenome]